MSFCIMQTSAPYIIPISDSVIMIQRNFIVASGNIGTENLKNPYVPIFSKTPARITEPAVGASVCASGSQVWNGNIGTLMANAKKKPQNRYTCKAVENCGTTPSSVGMSKVNGCPAVTSCAR